jgi:serine/threonine-protein kinase
LGRLKFFYDWDWLAAEREFKRAIELNPNDTLARSPYSYELVVTGRLDEGMAVIKRARDLDPLSLMINAAVGWHFYASRHYEQAIVQWQKTVEMDPNPVLPHWGLWRVFRFKGRDEEALAECRAMFSLLGHREVV